MSKHIRPDQPRQRCPLASFLQSRPSQWVKLSTHSNLELGSPRDSNCETAPTEVEAPRLSYRLSSALETPSLSQLKHFLPAIVFRIFHDFVILKSNGAWRYQ